MKTFEVEVFETYPGSQWNRVKIKIINGYGQPPPEFVMVRVDTLNQDQKDAFNDIFGGSEVFRPEFAKLIKKGLESVKL